MSHLTKTGRSLRSCAAFLAVSLVVAGCSPSVQRVPTFISPNVPQALLTCKAMPPEPTGEFTQRDVAVYIVNARAAHRSCSGNLAAVNKQLQMIEIELLEQAKQN